jgi:hypothetical protein
MTETSQTSSENRPERNEAVQAVVDRVGSYQDGAPEGTVEKELRAGLDEAGLSLTDDEVTSLVSAIEAGDDAHVDVASVLG